VLELNVLLCFEIRFGSDTSGQFPKDITFYDISANTDQIIVTFIELHLIELSLIFSKWFCLLTTQASNKTSSAAALPIVY
jgi:hypothetical protein